MGEPQPSFLHVDTPQLTHFKASIDDANSGAGDIEPSLNLSDGAFGVTPRQGFGEKREGKNPNKDLQKRDIVTHCPWNSGGDLFILQDINYFVT